jgi:hypothetical protein
MNFHPGPPTEKLAGELKGDSAQIKEMISASVVPSLAAEAGKQGALSTEARVVRQPPNGATATPQVYIGVCGIVLA